jgi:hypothetical protein
MQLLPAAEIGEAGNGAGAHVRRSTRAILRRSIADKPIRIDDELLGFMERFGPPVSGTVHLEKDAVVFEGEDGERVLWRLDDITAVQPSARTVQLKLRNQPILSLRFPGGSPRVWEELIVAALRAHYRRTGQGEIREFQPRIVARNGTDSVSGASGSPATHG